MTVENLLTPVGRIVWGNPGKATHQKYQDGPQKGQVIMKDGKAVEQWACGIAIPKAEFNQYVLPYLQQEAFSAYNQGVPQKFSWKYIDGDGIDGDGKPYGTREGYAGHFVLTVKTTAFAPAIYKREANGFRQLDPKEIKCGDYVVVCLNIKVNIPTDRTHTPGLYVNPVMFEFVAFGQEIVNSANPETVLGKVANYQLPVGASLTPVATNNGVQPPMQPQQPYNPPQNYNPPASVNYNQVPPGQAYNPPAPPPVAQPYVQPAAPQNYNPPMQPQQPYNPPVQPQQPPAGAYPPPAHDFVNNAGGMPPMQPQQPYNPPQNYNPQAGQNFPGQPQPR